MSRVSNFSDVASNEAKFVLSKMIAQWIENPDNRKILCSVTRQILQEYNEHYETTHIRPATISQGLFRQVAQTLNSVGLLTKNPNRIDEIREFINKEFPVSEENDETDSAENDDPLHLNLNEENICPVLVFIFNHGKYIAEGHLNPFKWLFNMEGPSFLNNAPSLNMRLMEGLVNAFGKSMTDVIQHPTKYIDSNTGESLYNHRWLDIMKTAYWDCIQQKFNLRNDPQMIKDIFAGMMAAVIHDKSSQRIFHAAPQTTPSEQNSKTPEITVGATSAPKIVKSIPENSSKPGMSVKRTLGLST